MGGPRDVRPRPSQKSYFVVRMYPYRWWGLNGATRSPPDRTLRLRASEGYGFMERQVITDQTKPSYKIRALPELP